MANCFCPAISFGGVFTALALLACASTARAGDLPPHPRLLLTPAVEALGRRWIHDLGGDDYNLPGYFGGSRWSYFRLNARSHNVILIGDEMQNPRC